MSARRCRLEFVRTNAIGRLLGHDADGRPEYAEYTAWYWRFIASNGKELARSSETYRNRVDCIRSAELTTGCYMVREHGAAGLAYCWRSKPYEGGTERVNVRWVR